MKDVDYKDCFTCLFMSAKMSAHDDVAIGGKESDSGSSVLLDVQQRQSSKKVVNFENWELLKLMTCFEAVSYDFLVM